MRLTESNISFVKIHCRPDGVAYSYFVGTKPTWECRAYYKTKNGRSSDDNYPFKKLPKAVQSFIKKHQIQHWSECDGYRVYILRKEN